MLCQFCSYDNLKVERTLRGIESDTRIIRCLNCNRMYITETKITGSYKPVESTQTRTQKQK